MAPFRNVAGLYREYCLARLEGRHLAGLVHRGHGFVGAFPAQGLVRGVFRQHGGLDRGALAHFQFKGLRLQGNAFHCNEFGRDGNGAAGREAAVHGGDGDRSFTRPHCYHLAALVDVEDALRIAAPYHLFLRGILRQHGGGEVYFVTFRHLQHFLVQGDGLYVYLIFTDIDFAFCLVAAVGGGDGNRAFSLFHSHYLAALIDGEHVFRAAAPGDGFVGGVLRQHGGGEVKIIPYSKFMRGFRQADFGNRNLILLGLAGSQYEGNQEQDGE